MLRLTRTHRTRVSNRTAVFAAFLLIAATVASIGSSLNDNPDTAPGLVGSEVAEADTGQGGQVAVVSRNKGFKVNLYLFRRN
jgi:hypothetical protein